MTDARREFAAILADKLGTCEDRYRILAYPCLQDWWEFGGAEDDDWLLLWVATTFANSEEERRRILRVLDEPLRMARFLQRVEYQESGRLRPINFEFIRASRRRLLVAMYPSTWEIVTEAEKHPADMVSENIKRLMTEQAWRKRY